MGQVVGLDRVVSMRRQFTRISGLISIAVLGPLLLAGCSRLNPAPPVIPLTASAESRPASASSSAVPTYTVRRGQISGELNVRGRVVAVNEAPLVFRIGGHIKKLNVTLGQEVQAGELLAEVEGEGSQTELAKAKADFLTTRLSLQATRPSQADAVARAKIGVTRAERSVERARLTLARVKAGPAPEEIEAARLAVDQARKLLWATQIERDAAKGRPGAAQWEKEAGDARVAAAETAVTMAETRLKALEAGAKVEDIQLAENVVEANEVELEAARAVYQAEVADRSLRAATLQAQVEYYQALYDQLDRRQADTKLLAPFKGIVVALDANTGDRIEPYSQIGTLADPSRIQVEANIKEAEVGLLGVGSPASIVLDGFKDDKFGGVVSAIATKPNLWQGQNVYTVTIGFNGGQQVPATMRMGSDLTISGKSRDNALLVPRQAILIDSGQPLVEKIVDGKARRVEVRTGVSNGEFSEILGGLREGDVIVEGRRP